MQLFAALGSYAVLLLLVLTFAVLFSGYRPRGGILCSASLGVVSGTAAGLLGSAVGNIFFASLLGALGGIAPSLRAKWEAAYSTLGMIAGALAGSITATLAVRYGYWSEIMLEWLAFCLLLILIEFFFFIVVREIG